MRSGFARWFGRALIVMASSCDPLAFTESSQHAAIGDGGATIDDTMVVPDDAMVDAMPDAMVDAMPDAMIDAPPPDASPPDGMPPDDGGPGDGSVTDAMNPDARQPPGLPPGGSHDDDIKSFYACSTGQGASMVPLLLALLALRRRMT